jgi:hypothetical protein
MKKRLRLLSACLLVAGVARAGLYINAGPSSTSDGQGPLGANTSYLAYISSHEASDAGALQTFDGVSFAEGGVSGAYNVGVSFTWLDATTDASKQAFNRANDQGYEVFWQTWIGMDVRSSSGGINGGDRLKLSLTGLAADTEYVFTSYHADTSNQSGTFTVDQTPIEDEASTSPFSFPSIDDNADFTPWVDNAYSFSVTSDSSGNLDITYTQNSGSWIGINGFDLVAVPEPATIGMLGLGSLIALLVRRQTGR